MNAEQAWQTVLGQLQMEMPRASFDTWVRDTRLISYQNGTLIVGVRNAYARDWLENRLASTVNRLLVGILNASVNVDFVVNGNEPEPVLEETATANSQPEAVDPYDRPARPSNMNPRYLFETFVVGSGNRLAHAACQAVAEKPARAYNPLFLYGGVGLGKTHLLHAIGNACHKRGLNVLYVSSEEFTNDMINAIRTNTNQAFREKYRSADVLLVDDIQFIAGKESTQEEFFHTFNTLHGQDKQIIVSSDRPPKSLNTLDERLRSRFEWGLIADIQPPDLETKVAILKRKAEAEGVGLPDNVALFIAGKIKSNIRELEGSLIRLVAYASLTGREISLSLAQDVLRNILQHDDRAVTIEVIQKFVADYYQLKLTELKSRNNSKSVAMPRQIAMYLCKSLTNASLPEIGRSFGGKHHSTVIHSVRKIEELRKRDGDFNTLLNTLSESLR